MNKADLINKIADDTGITKTQANDALDSFIEAVTKTLTTVAAQRVTKPRPPFV